MGYRFTYTLEKKHSITLDNVYMPSPLQVQLKNASCALTASIILKKHFNRITDETLIHGLEEFSIPGRFHVFTENPTVIFDPAHNEAALSEVMKSVKKRYGYKKIIMVLTLMMDKDIDKIISLLSDYNISVYYYAINDPRCFNPGMDNKPDLFERIFSDKNELFTLLDESVREKMGILFSGSFRLYETALDYVDHMVRGEKGR
jgi:folylpolyglutamate synthase/dihydropteroate synthase